MEWPINCHQILSRHLASGLEFTTSPQSLTVNPFRLLMSCNILEKSQISPIWLRRHKNLTRKHRTQLKCIKTCCLLCTMNELDPFVRRSGLAKCFSQLHLIEDEDLVITLNGLWNVALSQPDDAEFPSLGIFKCMAKLIDRSINDGNWPSRGKNACVPYYAAHIIGSYTMNKAQLADIAIKSGVIGPLMELLRGKASWIEQRVAVRALGHLASHRRAFRAITIHEEEIISLSKNIASTCFGTVYNEFVRLKSHKRVEYHRDLMTRGCGGLEVENKKAEEWASQLQCWSLYLLNCFATKKRSLNLICDREFLEDLTGMWGGLQNQSSFSGVCLIRSLCLTKDGRRSIANSKQVIVTLCNLSRSSDKRQYKAIESILSLLQDQETRFVVIEFVVPFLVDLVELKTIRGGGSTTVGDRITRVLLQDYGRIKCGQLALKNKKSQNALDEVWNLKVERRKKDSMTSEQDVSERKVMVGMLKREGNQKFLSGDTEEAVAVYTKALELCLLNMIKERIVLYSNRAQCHLLLREAKLAISDTTRALCLSGALGPHSNSLWRRSQAYDMLGMARQSMVDCLMLINQWTKFKAKGHVKIPYYAVRMFNKQISATSPFGTSTPNLKIIDSGARESMASGDQVDQHRRR
ncbi:uncharacterized protein [Coffea arabica]|uniref:ARM repeat N-terminal plant domain-containing protein n=1 Tax=Coffea arabica TaxID=13443 RepID=A0A6P6TK29_COFAR|nr:uncharacterized protein LOC113701796 [Coffea arabica]